MQPVSSALYSVLEQGINNDPAAPVRDLSWTFEFYDPSVLPGPDGFNPAQASQRFAMHELTWLGLAYRRIVLGASDISIRSGREANTCTVRLSNADENRTAATWVTKNQVEGMRLVVRLISRSASVAITDSAVRFVGRCEKPDGFDAIQGSVTAKAGIADIEYEFPPRIYQADDPEGRSPADPLNEGFPFLVINGTFTHRRPEPDRAYSRRDPRRYFATLPWSSYDETPLGEAIPLVLGRTQLSTFRGVFADTGRITKCIDFLCMGPIAGVRNFRMDNPPEYNLYFTQPELVTIHLGEAGGTGTQIADPLWPNYPLFSYTAYAGYQIRYIGTGAFSQIDAGHNTVMLVLGMVVPLPDSSGVYNTQGWTDDGAHLTRFLRTDPRFFNQHPAFMEDSAGHATALYNAEPVVDDSNAEQILVPAPELAQAGQSFRRYRSTGLIGVDRARFDLLLDLEPPEGVGATDFIPFDFNNPPALVADVRRLRKRFTTNVLLRKRVKGKDFLYNTVLPSFRGYIVDNWRGKEEIRSERAADFAHLRGAVLAGASSIPVEDVTPWRAAGGLWGRALVGASLPEGVTASEARKVASADYAEDANAITLAAAATGTLTVAVTGATLAGGSSSSHASGAVTVGGAPQAGAQVSATIQGIQVAHTLVAGDTLATAAYMLAAHVNANTQLRRFVSAEAAGAVVTVRSKWGVLNLSSALANPHGGPVSNPTAAPSGITASGSGSSLAAGVYRLAYANRNANGSTYLSPYAAVTVSAGQQINVPALALPSGVASRDWFMSKAAGDTELVLHSNHDGNAFSVTSPPPSTGAFPPEYNTTGEEVIRIALPFASNNQDPAHFRAGASYAAGDRVQPSTPNGLYYTALDPGTAGAEPAWPTAVGATVTTGGVTFARTGPTILAQAGLARGNVFRDTYKWPNSGKQPTYTQVVGSYVNAANDFAESKVELNDKVQRERLGKTNPVNLDLTAVDNWPQARRLAYYYFSKHIDHHWFNSLRSNGPALLLEEHDVISASDDSGGHVNVTTRVEEFTVHLADFTVSIQKARLYSTKMFLELVPKTRPVMPTVLEWVAPVDTLFQFLDLPPWRESDAGLGPHFQIAAWFDPNATGSRKGYSVWLDTGAGYVNVREWDVEAVTGVALTALPDHGAGSDTTSTVRIKLNNPADTLVTATDDELRAGKNLYRLGGEIFQAPTRTPVAGTEDTYDLSGKMIRGRLGTEGFTAGHTAGEEFTVLDGTILSIPLDASHAGGEIKIKLVTVNQDLADATEHAKTWEGRSRLPLPIARVELDEVTRLAPRNKAGSILSTLWPRTNLEGVGDEYLIEYLSDDGAEVMHQTSFREGDASPAMLVRPVGDMFGEYVTGAEGNTFEKGASGGIGFEGSLVGYAKALQLIRAPHNFVEATLSADLGAVYLGLYQAGRGDWLRQPESALPDRYVLLDALDTPTLKVFDGTTETVVEDASAYAATGQRISLVITPNEVNFHKTGGPPFASVPLPAFPAVLALRIKLGHPVYAGNKIGDIFMTTNPLPTTVFSAARQREKYGTLKKPVRVRIRQHSGIRSLGYGLAWEGWI